MGMPFDVDLGLKAVKRIFMILSHLAVEQRCYKCMIETRCSKDTDQWG